LSHTLLLLFAAYCLQVVLVSEEAQLVAEINTTADAAPAAAAAATGANAAQQQSLAADSHEQQLQALLSELGLVLELRTALFQAYSRHVTAAAAAATLDQRSDNASCSSCGCWCSDGSCSCCTFAGRQLHHYSSAEVVLLVRTARRLLAAAVRAGCPATAACVLGVAGLGLQAPEQLLVAAAVAGEGELSGDWRGAQLSLLHLAVASQNPQMVSF
jgi:hypothetical protein